MIKRAINILFGILLIPICIACTKVFYNEISNLKVITDEARFFLSGVGSYVVLHLIFTVPTRPYVFGHELLHAIATWVSFGKVKSFKASSQGGSVTTTKSNIFISLAPYFFPIYTIIFAFLYFAISLFRDPTPFLGTFIFLVGFTLTFHIVFTANMMKTKQPDLITSGYVLSIALIYVVNVTIVALIVSLLFRTFTMPEYFKASAHVAKELYSFFFRGLFL